MKKKVKEKLVEALLSGRYEKCKGAMRSTRNRFCVEGVLCDLYKQETGKGEWSHVPEQWPLKREVVSFVTGDDKVYGYGIPPEVSKWAGSTYSKSLGMDLIALNDIVGLNFGDLAETVRTHF